MKIALKKSIVFVLCALLIVPVIHSQDTKENKRLKSKSLVESKRYVFIAEQAMPMNGRNIQLSYGYQLEVRNDKLTSDLPYYGRAFTAPIDPTQGGFRFTTTDFDYHADMKKKGNWYILIKPAGANDVNQFSLDVTKTGRATLQVVSNNRQPISFSGYIADIKERK